MLFFNFLLGLGATLYDLPFSEVAKLGVRKTAMLNLVYRY